MKYKRIGVVVGLIASMGLHHLYGTEAVSEEQTLRVSKNFHSTIPIKVRLIQDNQGYQPVSFKKNTDRMIGKNKPLRYNKQGGSITISAEFNLPDDENQPRSQKSSVTITAKKTFTVKDLEDKELIISLKDTGCSTEVVKTIQLNPSKCLEFTLRPRDTSNMLKRLQKKTMNIVVRKTRDNSAHELKVSVIDKETGTEYSTVTIKNEPGLSEKKIKLPTSATNTAEQAEKDLKYYGIKVVSKASKSSPFDSEKITPLSNMLLVLANVKKKATLNEVYIGIGYYDTASFSVKRISKPL